jgi:hypothetical protein
MQNYRELAEKQLAAGKPLTKVKSSLDKHFKQIDKQEFYKAQKAEYDELFPTHTPTMEVSGSCDKADFDEVMNERKEDEEDIITNIQTVDTDGFDYSFDIAFKIDYSEDETYVTLEQYRNETIVITEAIEAVYDEEGIEVSKYIPEVTEAIRPYIELDVTERVETYPELLRAVKINEAKKVSDSISSLVVKTSNGNIFDATLEARQNLADAILASDFLAQTEATWRLADNSEVQVQITELKEAHALALQAYATTKSIG